MKTAIMTDTNSGMWEEAKNTEGLFVIPMPVIIDGEEFTECENITYDELFGAIKAERDIHSSQPSIGEVIECWDRLLNRFEEVVYIPMSSGLSGSCETAVQFAKPYGRRVSVVDNHRISVTLYEAVKDAVGMARAGLSGGQIRERLEENAYQASIYVAVNSLEYLKRSGRVTAAEKLFSQMVNMKPVLTIQGGKLEPYARARGMKQAERKMIEAVDSDIRHRFGKLSPDRIRIGAAGTFEREEDTAAWTNMVRNAFPQYEVYYQPLSCSIACHVGYGAAGIGISVTDGIRDRRDGSQS